jgi:hypothetical protein
VQPNQTELLQRLVSHGGLDDDLLARAQRVFEARGDEPRRRWMQLEQRGYGADTEAGDLHASVGRDGAQGVIDAILRSRVRHGRLLVGGAVRLWPHFFVESVGELRALAGRVAGGGSEELLLDIGSAGGPRLQLSFPRHVFAHVLQAVAVELGDALRKDPG